MSFLRDEYPIYGGKELSENVPDAGEYTLVGLLLVRGGGSFIIVERYLMGAQDKLKAGRRRVLAAGHGLKLGLRIDVEDIGILFQILFRVVHRAVDRIGCFL